MELTISFPCSKLMQLRAWIEKLIGKRIGLVITATIIIFEILFLVGVWKTLKTMRSRITVTAINLIWTTIKIVYLAEVLAILVWIKMWIKKKVPVSIRIVDGQWSFTVSRINR